MEVDLLTWKEYITPILCRFENITECPPYKENDYVPLTSTICGILTLSGSLDMIMPYSAPGIEDIDNVISFYNHISGIKEITNISKNPRFPPGSNFQYEIATDKLYFASSYCRVQIPSVYKIELSRWFLHCVELFKILHPKLWANKQK